jgi:thiol-disulfide isomerase/thioredoxin
MTDEKGGSIVFILIVLVCGILWSNQHSAPKADFTQPVDGLIDEVASVREFRTLLPGKTGLIMNPVETSNHIADANKMVDPSPSDKPKAKPEIIIFTSSSCPPCERWKRCEAPKFEANGWKVAYCEQHPYPRTPTFLITENGRAVEKVGYFTFEDLREVLK